MARLILISILLFSLDATAKDSQKGGVPALQESIDKILETVEALISEIISISDAVEENESAIEQLQSNGDTGTKLYRRSTTIYLDDRWNHTGIIRASVQCRTDGDSTLDWDEIVSAGFSPESETRDGSVKLIGSWNSGRAGFNSWSFMFDARERAHLEFKGRISLHANCIDKPPYNEFGGQFIDWY